MNADVYVNANGDLLGYNMYAYCSNNPVMGYDPTGHFDEFPIDLDIDDPYDEHGPVGGGGNPTTSINSRSFFKSSFTKGRSFKASRNIPKGKYHVKPGKINFSDLPNKGTAINSTKVLELAERYLGAGYTEVEVGRFVSSDKARQVRIQIDGLLGEHAGGPHVNFDRLSPSYKTKHIYFYD